MRALGEPCHRCDCLPGLVPRLIDLLDDEDPVVQGGVCNALQKVGAAAFPAIVRATKDHRVRVRSSAVGLLGGFVKHPEAVLPVILASFSDDEVLVRRAAVGALSWFLFVRKQSPELPSLTQEQRHRIVRTLASALSDKDQASSCHDFTVDVRAAITLIDLGPEASEAIPDFLAALKSPAIPLKGRAIAALGYLKAERRVAIPAILQALAENVPPNEADTSYLRQCAIGALSILADPGPESEPAIPLLLWGLEEKSLDTIYHRLAAQALGKIGPKARPAITPLQDLLTARRNLVADPDPQFRVELEKALTNIGK